MKVALLPPDEAALVTTLLDLGVVLLASEVTVRGEPEVVTGSPPQPDLPREGGPPDQLQVLLFWNPTDGPVSTLAETPRLATYRTAKAFLGIEEIQDRYPDEGWRDVVDPGRSPVIRLTRSSWTTDGRLRPGQFGAMAEWTSRYDQPAGIREKTRTAQEWIRVNAERLEPPKDVGGYRRDRRQRQASVVWALPDAATWLRSGGQLARS
jgi:hypothetical protein